MIQIVAQLCKKAGIDRSVAWTLITQGTRFFTGVVTMFLMVNFLTLEAQGYAYTFGGILGISVFLEMGFSQNILQFASHEFAKLEFAGNRSLSGDAEAFSRFVSLGRLAFKYYAIASLGFLLAAVFGGSWFFETSGHSPVHWQTPWAIACVTSSAALLLNPCWSLLQGCNQIAEIERFRFVSALLGFVALAAGLLSGCGLYAVTFPGIVATLAAGIYLVWRWPKFFAVFLDKPASGTISWRREIWPFQWRIAVSWICGYFIFTAITPVVFRISGATAAGRIGFTLQLLRTVSGLATSWTSTKIPLFGMLVARLEWRELERVWRRATLMTVMVSVVGSAAAILALAVLGYFVPVISTRYSGPSVAILFAISLACQNLISGLAYYLRAFKREPFVGLSVLQAALCFGLVILLTLWMDEFGAALGYMLATVVMLVPAWLIFQRKRLVYQTDFHEAAALRQA